MAEGWGMIEDMWTPYKELQTTVEVVVSQPLGDGLKRLDDVLRNHKQNFLTLLRNPPKDAHVREAIVKGITDGITIPGVGHQVLSKDLVDEALIISDMYNLNENMALALLYTAQRQMPHHPGLTRGLVAVLLYYDGRKAIVTALRTLVQARKGISWAVDTSEEVITYITRFTQELMDNGIISKILHLIQEMDLSKEIELLQQNRALGGPRHHCQIVELYQTIRQILADIVYLWAAQGGLPKEPTCQLINQLRVTKIQEDPKGGIDGVTLGLEMALLYALDLSILQRREDGEDIVQKLPLMAEADFVQCLMRELSPGGVRWESRGLQAITFLAWGLSIASLRMAPQSLHPKNLQDEDDLLVDSAIDLNVFDFFHHTFLNNKTIYKEQFYLRRLHSLLTDFIVLMPLKVKELRNHADETARTIQIYTQEGLEPPSNLPHHFEHLLLSVACLYDTDPLSLDLVADYWCPAEGMPASSYTYRSPPRQVSLYKFVRLAGDLLPTALFVPYMKMLRSLSASPKVAKHAFNLLKQNGPGSGSSVSWDHFFNSLSQYYSNLRQELPPTTDTVYRHRNYPRGITPQEIQGLQTVLSLIRTVAEHDEYSRVALCDNLNWSPLSVLLGLVSCSVPIPLKAELLLTLAALARSPDTAATLWHNIEASQILLTIPSTSCYQPRGVQTELEEIESRNEEFPLTRALLHLLDVLTDVPVPKLLGVGTRVPGFDPYLNFIINSVFLKFNTRSYKNPEEKWKVGKSCLHLLVKFLEQYEPRVEDFSGGRVELQGGGTTQVNPPPGYHIMVYLNSKTELLRLVLHLVDEGCHLLDSYTTFAGKESLEASMLCSLQLIDKALALQQRFFSLLSSATTSRLLTGLNKLLLDVNPRSGKPDHLLNIAKYITYNNWLSHHSLVAVEILLAVTSYPASHAQLLGVFTSSQSIQTEIRHGFVECLEADSSDLGNVDDDDLGVQDKTKETILRLLQQCLGQSSPNVAHYLFGFDIMKDIKKTMFQQPGVLGFPRTCLHSLVAILDASISTRSIPSSGCKPRLLEAAYCMLHSLCANNRTSEPVLRFLRSSGDFLARHCAALPFIGQHKASELNQMAWLLKTVAIELRVTASNLHFSQLGLLVHLLVKEPEEGTEDTIPDPQAGSGMQLSQYLTTPTTTIEASMQHEPLLLKLLSCLDFSVEKVPVPSWEFFEPTQIEQVIMSCETNVAPGLRLIDVKTLHRILMSELQAIQVSSTAGQRQVILQEIQQVLVYALKHNGQRSRASSTVRYMDAWRQVTEVLFAVAPYDVLPLDYRKQLLLGTVHLLLRKVLSHLILPELANLSSGAVLLLLVNLRHCYVMRQKQARYGSQEETVMEDTTSGQAAIAEANMATLKVILTTMLEWILSSGVSSQKVRVNLYGSLLNFLQIVCLGGAEKYHHDHLLSSSQYVSRLDSSRYRATIDEFGAQRQASLDVIVGFGEGLVDVLCHDCTGGHDVCKMLALSCLDMLIQLDSHTSWVSFLSSRGYLKNLIDSLLDADDKLVSLLETVPDTLRPLYVYESKMAMLCRVASTRSGAQMLLEQNAIACLSSMCVFDRHPDVRPNMMGMDIDFVPSVGNRYLQILFPALDLCDSVLTALGTDNQSCSTQILHFLLSHSDMVTQVLRSGSPYLQVCYLKELARLTGVIARAANQDVCNVSKTAYESTMLDGMAHLQRIQKLMLSLFPRFTVSDSTLRDLSGPVTTAGGATSEPRSSRAVEDKTEALLRFFQVACNLALYARNIVSSRGVDHRASNVIFKAGLAESGSMERRGREYLNVGESGTPNLGVVVQQLVQCVSHYHQEKTCLDLLMKKYESVPNMNSAELKEFMLEESVSRMPVTECRSVASEQLEKRLSQKRQELEYCLFLIENCLYLVWCHLDYYMLRAIPKSQFGSGFDKAKGEGFWISITESSWHATSDEISQLKQGLVAIFNDTFCKKLIDTRQDQPLADKGFVEALLRRIKRLIQFVPVK